MVWDIKSNELISSANNIANAYILFLIAKIKVGLTRKELERYIGKWFSFSSLTSRYSFSPESQMESDLNAFRTRDRAEFIKSLAGIIDLNSSSGTHPTCGIHESPQFGADWQYWSRPLNHWAQTKRRVKDVMAHIHHLFDTL